jgi:hypothetical protein
VEVSYPGMSAGRSRVLRLWAGELGLATSGGSDCHGPGNHLRAIGSSSITAAELERLRQLTTD